MAMLILLPKTKRMKMVVRFVEKMDSNAIMNEF
jgi:hypothetical protein